MREAEVWVCSVSDVYEGSYAQQKHQFHVRALAMVSACTHNVIGAEFHSKRVRYSTSSYLLFDFAIAFVSSESVFSMDREKEVDSKFGVICSLNSNIQR